MPYCRRCGTKLPDDASFCHVCGTPVTPRTPAPAAEPAIKLASWSDRLVAFIIDIIILSIVLAPFKMVTLWLSWPSLTIMHGFPRWLPFIEFGLDNIIQLLYWTVMEGAYGQSFGKMILRIKVVRVNGSRIDFAQAGIESLGKALIFPLDVVLGWVFYSYQRQRLFNYLSGTIVVRTSDS